MNHTRTCLMLAAAIWIAGAAVAHGQPPSPHDAGALTQPTTGNAPSAITSPHEPPIVQPGMAAPVSQPQVKPSNPLPLAKPGESAQTPPDGKAPPSRGRSISTVLSSLAIVLGLFFGVVWVAKRHAPKGASALPSDVVESLGRAPLSGRQQMQLVRVGTKLILVALSPSGAQTLTEVTDPEEVERLAAACEDGRSGSSTGSFRQVLSELGGESSPRGFFGRLAGGGAQGGQHA